MHIPGTILRRTLSGVDRDRGSLPRPGAPKTAVRAYSGTVAVSLRGALPIAASDLSSTIGGEHTRGSRVASEVLPAIRQISWSYLIPLIRVNGGLCPDDTAVRSSFSNGSSIIMASR